MIEALRKVCIPALVIGSSGAAVLEQDAAWPATGDLIAAARKQVLGQIHAVLQGVGLPPEGWGIGGFKARLQHDPLDVMGLTLLIGVAVVEGIAQQHTPFSQHGNQLRFG